MKQKRNALEQLVLVVIWIVIILAYVTEIGPSFLPVGG